MAQGTSRRRRPAATSKAQGSDVQVGVTVPQNHSITVTDLKALSERELVDLIEKVKVAKVGFVILNAPFKVQQSQLPL